MGDTGAPHIVDVDLSARQVQGLGSADAVAALFSELGYHTGARLKQTPANIGIATASVARPIKRLELIADQDSALQVYLFELTSVTIAQTKALARAFRNRAGNYLLVLTSDYERIDFVLVEKFLPTPATGAGISQRQTGVRPRILTVERRKPDPIQLRVLRRFTYTESDPYYQYDKLLSAFTIADWSEEHFNNRALFSDYYLTDRLQRHAVWSEDPKPAFKALIELYRNAASKWAGKGEAEVRSGLIEPVLRTLGLQAKPGKRAGDDAAEPDYRLFGERASKKPLAVCLAYPWGRSLDGKDDTRDKETPDENPGAVVVSVLEEGEAPWAVVTNGKTWRLYSARTHSRATNYYEIDLEETLAHGGPRVTEVGDAFRYFWLLFRREAFEETEYERDGEQRSAPFLDWLLDESEDYSKELGERLKERVFVDVFPHLARGFVEFIRQRDGKRADLSREALDSIFEGTLSFLYRVLFLLYSEARDLLPVREVRGYWEKSLKRIKQEVADHAGKIDDEAEANLKKHYRRDRYELYDRLSELFAVVDGGSKDLNVPVYNGGLFITEPDPEDDSDEARAARFLAEHKIPDFYLACGLDLVARGRDPRRGDLVPVDYKSLYVRQLGSIYEGLLEFRVEIAPRKLGVVKQKGRDVYVPFKDLDERAAQRAAKAGRVVKKGAVYVSNDKSERKATGSYYTPDHIVKYIVRNAVGPVLKAKFEAMTPKLREAERAYRDAVKRAEAFRKQGRKGSDPEKVATEYRHVVDDLFSLRVLDPAMGSGHFLVEAVDYITDQMIVFLNGFPWNPVSAELEKTRRTILESTEEQGVTLDRAKLTPVNLLKRHVLKRCIYGVDLNPMAVELAKVSLWLDCFTLGAPLSFLDHHLKCGNSLIGVTVGEVEEALSAEHQLMLFSSPWEGAKQALAGMMSVLGTPDITPDQVRSSRTQYRSASSHLDPFRRILDLYTSRWFGNEPRTTGRGKKKQTTDEVVDFLLSVEAQKWLDNPAGAKLAEHDRKLVETGTRAARARRLFHWDLEFPEVFYGPRPGTTQAVERLEGAGFDAVIGNPPYDVLAEKELGRDVSQELAFFHAASVFGPAIRGKTNLYKLFVCRGVDVTRPEGRFSLIVPMALLGDDQSSGVRKLLLEKTGLVAVEAFPQKDDPRRRVFPEAKLSTCVFVTGGKSTGERFAVRTHPGRFIESESPVLHVAPDEIARFDPANAAIPSCTQRDWDIASGIVRWVDMKRLGDYCQLHQGEINETAERPKRTLSDKEVGPRVLRGAAVTLYAVREASQGDVLYLHEKRFLRRKGESSRAFHHRVRRVGVQRKAPQNNFRRLIAAPIPEGSYCFESINYCIEKESALDLDLLAALLNTKLLDWYFRMSSSNAQVNEYQFNVLPAPTIQSSAMATDWKPLLRKGRRDELARTLCGACTVPGVMPKDVAEALAEMSRRIQKIEAKRKLKGRSERSSLAPESQPIQDAIDRVLFRCYGLSDDDADYVKRRLKEML